MSPTPQFSGFGISLANEGPVRDVLALARQAAVLGYDEVSLPESRLHNSVFSTAAAVLATTERIRVRIGVTNPVTRHPAILALEGATLAGIGGAERVILGVSAAEWTNKALGFAEPGWKPLTNTLETLRALRSWLAGEALGFTPTTFRSSPEARLDVPPVGRVQLDTGPVNAKLMEASGELADGVQLGALVSPGYVRWARERLAAGASRAGRTLDGFTVASNVLVSVDDDRAAARAAVREVLAYYLWRVEGVVVDTSGADPENVAAVRAAVQAGGPSAGAGLVSEQVIDTFAVAGTPDDVIAGLGAFAAAGLDVPLAWHTLGPDPARAVQTLAEIVRPRVTRALV
jgi:alkanesulfonate monooxygenase SsuD/methylene tetrahydromethanopterin reductase-like flavin-dependent oxidoreductase (luciferase family)